MDVTTASPRTSGRAARAAPLLLTPGPLTTSDATRAALARDWGSRHGDFLAISERVRARLAALAGAGATHAAIPIQGSGTFAVEAALTTLVPRDGRLLVAVNGAYAERMVAIARRARLDCVRLDFDETEPVDPDAIAQILARDDAISDVAVVHCETSSGILNPLGPIADVVARTGRRLHVDAMSAFGAIPIDAGETPFASLCASSNKGLEGVPGLAFAIVERDLIAAGADRATTLSLDLHAQWRGFERDGQWRFTPPVQVVAALDAALDHLEAEGGVAARHRRYAENRDVLVAGMRALGFETLLADAMQSPVIVTFRSPPAFDFERLYDALAARGFVIYPGKLARAESFRIGCIGQVFADDMRAVIRAIGEEAALRPVAPPNAGRLDPPKIR